MEGTAQGWSGLVLDGMRAMQGESVFTDVTLIAVDGSAVLAHSLVLAAGSAHFKDAFQKVRASGSMGTIMIKLGYTSATVQRIADFLYSGKISVPQTEMAEIKRAAKTLIIPTLEALCDTYTRNLDQFMQANDIPKDSEVSVQITHHVGDETEEEEAANEEHAPDNSDVLEELNNSQAMHTEQDGGERVTVEFDPETLQQLASSQGRIKSEEPQEAEMQGDGVLCDQAALPPGTVLVGEGLLSATEGGEEAYQVMDSCGGVITNIVSLEEVSKTVSIESLLAGQVPLPMPEMGVGKASLTEQQYSKTDARVAPPAGGGSTCTQVYRYRCNICNKDFSSLYRLKGHHATHFGEKAHQCGICGKKYIQLEYLREHESVHRAERPYKCTACGKDFRILRHLKKHQITHSDRRPYQCLICHKTFQRSDRIKAHMRTHSGEKPYRCELCGKSFSLRETLVKHMDTHTEYRPFKCSICFSEFKRKDGLQIHLETHRADSRFVCGVEGCSSGFNQLIHLKKHISSAHHLEDVNSFVVEKPKISADELDALLADVDARSDVTPSGDADEETPGDDADEETAGDEMHVEVTMDDEVVSDVSANTVRPMRTLADAATLIGAVPGTNEIGLVIRTRSQKAADGQVKELTSVETVPMSAIAHEDMMDITAR